MKLTNMLVYNVCIIVLPLFPLLFVSYNTRWIALGNTTGNNIAAIGNVYFVHWMIRNANTIRKIV